MVGISVRASGGCRCVACCRRSSAGLSRADTPQVADPWEEAADSGGIYGVLLAVNPCEVGLLDEPRLQLEGHHQESAPTSKPGTRRTGCWQLPHSPLGDERSEAWRLVVSVCARGPF